jgi:hypothetical protein
MAILKRRRVLGCALFALAGASGADDAALRRPLDAREKVSVAFTVVETSILGPTAPAMTMTQDLGVGQWMVADAMHENPFSFGIASGPEGCGSQMSIRPAESQIREHPLAWSADAQLLAASTERIVVRVNWKRLERGSDGEPVVAASESIDRIVLREGDRVLLDFARPPGSHCFRSASLELSVGVKEDPAVASRQIAYDIWLVHDRPDGKKTSARTQLTGRQGEPLPFAFPVQKLAATASGDPNKRDLQVEVGGRLRGRVRPDGTLVLSLDASRMLRYVALDGSNDGGIGDGGEKVVEVRPGETIRVELPDPARGPAVNDARASRMSQDLQGHAFSVIVTAKPVS